MPFPQINLPHQFVLPPLNGIDVYEVTVKELQQYMQSGILSSEIYTEYCIRRVLFTNPYLAAVIQINPDAVAIARALDDERCRGFNRGPLHGIPVLVKDNIATYDAQETTAGSCALLGARVPRDAHTIARLRSSGAVILGHANMSEWASLRSSDFSKGYSPRGGQVRNVFDLTLNPWGSSSGSAVAVSANICPLSLGTETDSSIIGPANFAGVVGIKPTVGLTSRAGVIPLSENLDTVGCFGRTVSDAVCGLSAIVDLEPDERDAWTQVPERYAYENYSPFLSGKHALNGAWFGVPMKRFWNNVPSDQKDLVVKLFELMQKWGAEIVQTDLPSASECLPEDGNWNWEYGPPERQEWSVVKVDAYNGINTYLSELRGVGIHTVKDIVDYHNDNIGTEGGVPGSHPAFKSGQDKMDEVLATKGVRGDTYNAALEYIHDASRARGIDAALKYGEKQLDALLICDRRGLGQQIAAQAGYPIITIPVGLDRHGLPVGLGFHQVAWKEAELIKWASAVEDLIMEGTRRRVVTPQYKNWWRKNLPVGQIPLD